MSDELEYPYNLFAAMKGKTKLMLPQILTADVLAGLKYALSTLPAKDQVLIQLRFAENKTLLETAAFLSRPVEETEVREEAALKRLRSPSRWNYIRYGIAGWQKENAAMQYAKGYRAGYVAGIDHSQKEIAPSPFEENMRNQPIAFLGLSVRLLNCLNRAGFHFVYEVADLDCETIDRMRNLGRIGADEIARALLKAGVCNAVWNRYLL